jgi:hypothetical protein
VKCFNSVALGAPLSYTEAFQLNTNDQRQLLSQFCLWVWYHFSGWRCVGWEYTDSALNDVKNVICNEIVPCFEGCSGFPCLRNNPGYFVRIFSHLCRMCVILFTLSHFVLLVPMKIIISGVHFTVAIIIRRSAFCILRFALSQFHIIFIGFRPAINAIIITYFIKQYHCTNTFGTFCVTSVQAIQNCPSAPETRTVALYLTDVNCQIQPN